MKGAFRAVYYVPTIISLAITTIIFNNLFSYFGVINELLVKFGFITERIDWFASRGSSLFVLVLCGIWSCFGINVLYFISALSNIPQDLYESAEIDGASTWKQFTHVTLPQLIPVGRTVLLLALLGCLSAGDLQVLLTNGAPNGETHTVMSYLTRTFTPGFADANPPIGYGCAMSVITSFLFLIVGILDNKIKKWSDKKYM